MMIFEKDDELDDLDHEEEEVENSPSGPVKNYITPEGHQKLKEEYHRLFHGERPKVVETIAWAASNGDRSENADYIYGKRRLREIDRRLKFLGKRLASAIVVTGAQQPRDKVLFGAKVTVEDENGKQFTYKIVGEDEINVDERKISWVSPMAKALMGSKLNESVLVQRPQGETELTVLKIEYENEE